MKVIIIGGGKTGSYIAELLLKSNCTVKIIDNRETVLDRLRNEHPADIIIAGSGSDPSVLEACGIMDADAVAAVTGSDEINLVASTIAKYEFNVPRVIARVNNPKNAWLFSHEMGVDVGLNQADLMARLVVEEMDFKNIFTLLALDHGDYSIFQVMVDKNAQAVNRTIKQLSIPHDTVLITVFRGGEVIIPRGDTEIITGDKILAFGNVSSHDAVNRLFGAPQA
jgi:trk system potassium uptake protein